MTTAFQKITWFLNSWIGKRVDYDKAFWHQCVDWAREFAKTSAMNPIGTFSGSAINGWKTGSPFVNTRWKRIEYKPWLIPSPSDIIFFNKTLRNRYGHVAIVGNADTKWVTVYEQNAIVGNGTGLWQDAVSKRTYLYKWSSIGNVVGWYSLNK